MRPEGIIDGESIVEVTGAELERMNPRIVPRSDERLSR